jgi:hypothetical protein
VYGQPADPGSIAYVAPIPGTLAAFAGRYQMPEDWYTPNAALTLADHGAYIEATWSNGGKNVIYPACGDAFVDRTYWAQLRFTRDVKGQITGFTYKLLQEFKARKLTAEP